MNNRLLYALSAASLVLSACSSTSKQQSTAEAAQEQATAEAQMCQDMNRLQTAVREYPDVTPETRIEVITDANNEIAAAVQEVKTSAQDVTNPRVLDLQSSYQKLRSTADALSGYETVGQASDALRSDARNFRDSWDRLYMSMECDRG